MTFSTIRDAMNSGETLVFGHRGAMAHAPMNTLASFQTAYDQGAQGVELDVQLSRDGHLVVVHDFAVDATTDGQGRVADLSLTALKALDAGGWFAEAFAGETIPTLDEVFAAFGDALLINVEIKSASDESTGLEQAVAECILGHDRAERVIVSSFNAHALRRVRAICPQLMIGYLYVPMYGDPPNNEIPYEALHPWHDLVDQQYQDSARRDGHYVNTWTVNDPARAIELKRLGVNAIMTDDPAGIIAALK